MKTITAAPGARITILPAEKFNTCRISINFIWPARRERATADALLPLVMERGYRDCPDMTELSKKLARLYGASLSVDGSMCGACRMLTVTVSGVKDKFALQAEPLSMEYAGLAFGVAFRPHLVDGLFDAESVAIEREQLREQLESEINEKRLYCIRQARRKFFGDRAAGIERDGYLDELDDVTPARLTESYRTMLHTARIEVVVLGADAGAAQACLAAALEELERTPCALPEPEAVPRSAPRSFEEPLPTAQGKLCLLFTPDTPFAREEQSVLRVATALLGALPTSRLFRNVREKQSLCYYCAAAYASLTSVLCIDSGIAHENAARARDAILAELTALRDGPIEASELADTKRALLDQLASIGDTTARLESWYISEMLFGSARPPEDVAREIEAVTADDVRRVLSRFSLSVCYTLTKGGASNG